jgi:outer membrane protein assembly factor BamB
MKKLDIKIDHCPKLITSMVVLSIILTIIPVRIESVQSISDYRTLNVTTQTSDSSITLVQFPIKINVLRGTGVPGNNDAERADFIDRAVQATNDILYRANVQLTWRVNWNEVVGDGDARIDYGELYGHIDNNVPDILNSYPGRKPRLKVYIADVIPDRYAGMAPIGSQRIALALGASGLNITNELKPELRAEKEKELGRVLAHEFGHAVGELDENEEDKDDLMYPHLGGGTNLSNEPSRNEAESIRAGAISRGGEPIRVGSLIHLDTKFTSWGDPLFEVSQNYIDLFIGSLFAEGPTADLEVKVGIRGLHPNGIDVDSLFQMGFDIDNNNSTGYNGVDKILEITLQGKYPFTTPEGSISVDLYDVNSETSIPLAPGAVKRIPEFLDSFLETDPEKIDYFDSIQQSLPLPVLGPLADDVPIKLWAINLDTNEYDFVRFQFEFNPPPSATIEMEPLEARAGQRVNVQGTRFPPLSTVTLTIIDTEILQTPVLSDGTFSTSLTVPNLAPGRYFVTAMSDQANSFYFDFSILTVPSLDWPMFRHDSKHTGYSSSKAPNTNSTLWTYSPSGYFAIADGMVFITSENTPRALNVTTGQLIWSIQTPFTTGGIAIGYNMVFIQDFAGIVYALDEYTGALKWNFTVGAVGRPTVADGMVFASTREQEAVYALDVVTGAFKWSRPLGYTVYSNPAIDSGMVFVATWGEGRVYALNESTGSTIWNSVALTPSLEASPVVVDDRIYMGGGNGVIYVLDKYAGALVRTYGPVGGYLNEGPVVAYDKLFVATDDSDRTVYAINEDTGSIVWSYYIGGGGGAIAGPNVADDKVFVGSNTLPPRFLALNQSTGELVWSYSTSTTGLTSETIIASDMAFGSIGNTLCAFKLANVPGDLNGDFRVSLADLVILAYAYGSKPGDSNWNPNADVDGNSVVGLNDLVILASNYGRQFP